MEAAVKEAFDKVKTPYVWRGDFVADDGSFKDDAPIDDFLDALVERMHTDVCIEPVFGSLSAQPLLPGPNGNYGGHIFDYKRSALAGRTIFTFGDKQQQPRRSMLLTLDTIMHGRKKKEGSKAQLAPRRSGVLSQFLRRNDNIDLYGSKTPEELWTKMFEGGKVRYPDPDLLIEAQIFGGINVANDVWGYVPACEPTAFYKSATSADRSVTAPSAAGGGAPSRP